MRIAYIAAILLGGAICSNITYEAVSTKILQEENFKANNDILSAFINNENEGIYLNDVNDEEIVEDSWSNTDLKNISVKIDASTLGNNRFLEIFIPVGINCRFEPESIVDGKMITSVDLSNYKQESISVFGNNVYTPDSGVIRYKISESATIVSIEDIFLEVDKTLCTNEKDEIINTNTQDFAFKLSVGDENILIEKKIDRIKAKNSFNNFSHYDIQKEANLIKSKDSYIRYYYDNTTSNKSKLLKNISFEISVPYINKVEDGVTKKKLANIKNINTSYGLNFEIVDDKIVITGSNILTSQINVSIDFNIQNEDIEPGYTLYCESKNIQIQGFFNENYIKKDIGRTSTWSILDETKEYISYVPVNVTTYKDDDKNIINQVAGFKIYNQGLDTNQKSLKFSFPKDIVGIKAMRVPLVNTTKNYSIQIKLWNKTNQQTLEHNVYINNNSSSSYLVTVNNLLNEINGFENIEDKDNYFIESIEYELGAIPSRTVVGTDYRGVNQHGQIYGVVFEEANNNDEAYIDLYVKNSDEETGYEKKCSAVITVKTDAQVTLELSAIPKRTDSDATKSIEAGEDFKVDINMKVYGYLYYTTMCFKNPILRIVVPHGVNIDTEKTIFKYSLTGESLDFNITNTDNPRRLKNGDFVYDIEIDTNNKIVGYYNENIQSSQITGTLYFNTSKSTKSFYFNPRERIFLEDKYRKSIGGGSGGAGYVKDTNDINGNGNTTETIATIHSLSTTFLIRTSSLWLNTDNFIDKNNQSEGANSIIIESSSDILKYNISINNDNEGYVQEGKFDYYIPIPKKDLTYSSDFKKEDEVFSFNMILEEPIFINGFKIEYSYNNLDFFEYNNNLDLKKVSMVRIVNTDNIAPEQKINIAIKMTYEEDSWDCNLKNSITWNTCGNQVYEKNGIEYGFKHKMDSISIKIIKAPTIIKNLERNISVNINENIDLNAYFNFGIPMCEILWQYRKNNTSEWVNLDETSTTLTLKNVDYFMNQYQYRYILSNEAGTVESDISTLSVIDTNKPVLTLTEIKEDNVYKIRIDVTDEHSGVSHIILPDGSRINSNTYILVVQPNATYTVKAYDIDGNETIKTISIMGELEPKNITSSLDIYIKSENSLSMSLDTNFIVFDNYSGVEDIEEKGAINITISSSLSYSLNAYVVENILNSDNSKHIDLNILNIKESDEADYQKFDGSNKLVLKDDCAKGNNKIHLIDLKLSSNNAHKADVYKTVLKFEVEQK